MAFTHEDGTGVTGANGYIDDTFFDTYFGDRANALAVALSLAEKQAAIIKASDYIDKRFGILFRGIRRQKPQGLEWPRIDAWDNDGYNFDVVPTQIEKATAEYALRAHNLTELAPDPALPFATRDSTGTGTTEDAGQVRKKMEKIGPIEEEISFHTDESFKANEGVIGSAMVAGLYIPPYPAADLWIHETIKNTTSRDTVRA